MSDNTSSQIVLTDAQRAQFAREADRFVEQMNARDLHPALIAMIMPRLEQAKNEPEITMDFLLTIGREIQGAVRRIHDATDEPNTEVRG